MNVAMRLSATAVLLLTMTITELLSAPVLKVKDNSVDDLRKYRHAKTYLRAYDYIPKVTLHDKKCIKASF